MLEGASALKLIIEAGQDTGQVDTLSAKRFGMRQIRVDGDRENAVAEHALALLMATARRIGAGHAGILAGEWKRAVCAGIELRGSRLGVVGRGPGATRLIELGEALGMEVVLHRRPHDAPGSAGRPNLSLADLLGSCHFVSLHLRADRMTRQMIDEQALARARRGLVLVNVGDGALIDLDACEAALERGVLGGLGLDAFPSSPPPPRSVFRRPDVVCTPGLAAHALAVHERIGAQVVQTVEALKTELARLE